MEEIYTQEILKNKQNRYEHITKRERDIISKHLFLCGRLPLVLRSFAMTMMWILRLRLLAMTMRGLNEVEKNYLAQISDNEEMVSPMPTSVFGFFTKIVGTAIKSYPL